MLTEFPIFYFIEYLSFEQNDKWLNPRYAILPPLHLNTVTRLSRALKFTNREQRQRMAGSSSK